MTDTKGGMDSLRWSKAMCRGQDQVSWTGLSHDSMISMDFYQITINVAIESHPRPEVQRFTEETDPPTTSKRSQKDVESHMSL